MLTLPSLPDDALYEILSHCDQPSRLAALAACRRLRALGLGAGGGGGRGGLLQHVHARLGSQAALLSLELWMDRSLSRLAAVSALDAAASGTPA